MINTTQILLVIVVIVLTILSTAIGLQIFYILKEFRKSVEKINKILDDCGVASGSVAKSIAGITGLTAGLRTILSLFGMFKKGEKNE